MIGGQKTKIGIVLLALLGLFGLLFPTSTEAASLTDLLRRQAELQRQAQESKKKIEQKQREASNIQNAISDIDEDISYTQNRISNTESQIETTQAVINALNAEIQQSQAQLDQLNEKLRIAYVSLYELSQTSTVESLLQSESLTDVVSQTQYIQEIQSELQANIEKANTLKAELETSRQSSETQKAELESLKAELSNDRNSLSRQRSLKNSLLQQTQGEQAKYEELVRQLNSQLTNVTAEIQAELTRFGSGAIGGGSDYGYAGWLFNQTGYNWFSLSYFDPNVCYNPPGSDNNTYCLRNCTSYAAFRWQAFGQTFRGAGNAKNWDNLAVDRGYTVSSSPIAGSIAVWDGGTYGHVAMVESVSANTFTISQYNIPINGKWGLFSVATKVKGASEGSLGVPKFIHPK